MFVPQFYHDMSPLAFFRRGRPDGPVAHVLRTAALRRGWLGTQPEQHADGGAGKGAQQRPDGFALAEDEVIL